METRVADCPLGAKCEEVKMEEGRQVMYRCPWYVKCAGIDNNTGEHVDHWGCAIAWMPALMINTANETRQGAAATESFRNEMVKQNVDGQNLIMAAVTLTNRKTEKLLNQADICN